MTTAPIATPPPYAFGRFVLLPTERRFLVDGNDMALGPRAFDLLLALVERAGRLVSKRELLDLVWPNLVVEESNLSVQMSTLRKVLGSSIISTIPGRGYRFSAVLETPIAPAKALLEAPFPEAAVTPADDSLSTSHPPSLRSTSTSKGPPARLSRLLGRKNDVVLLKALLDEHALVSIVGAGGIGKTHLAQAIALSRMNEYTDGVVWIELASQTDPATLPSAIAMAMGLSLAPSVPPLTALIASLSASSRLIVLDGAEHLRDAVAQTIVALAARAAQVRFLVTSQVRLNLPEEHVYRLGALSMPDSNVSAQEALEYSAVALFVARVQALDRRFQLSAGNVDTIVNICRRLDGIALALELAAARLPSLGLQALAVRLDERFRLLVVGNSAAPTRQQTLSAAFDWSYGLLSQSEQVLFQRLGVFVGGFTLHELVPIAAVEDGTDEWSLIDRLSELVERSLVSVDASDEPRYSLLESARAFAWSKLISAGEETVMRKRHLAYYCQRAVAAYRALERVEWSQHRTWLTTNYANVRAALEWSLEASVDVQSGATIAAALNMFWYETGQTQEHSHWLELAYKSIDSLSPVTQARVFLGLGGKCLCVGEYDQAEVHFTASIAKFAPLDSVLSEWATACNDLAVVKHYKNAYDEARPLLVRALAVMRELGNRKEEGMVLSNLASGHFSRGEIQQAEPLFMEALLIAHAMRDELGIAKRLISLAECAYENGQMELALERGREGLSIQRHFGESRSLANWLQRLSRCDIKYGDIGSARDKLSNALRIYSALPHPAGATECMDNCAALALVLGEPEWAARLVSFADVWRTTERLTRSPIRQQHADATLAGARTALGHDAFDVACAAGRAMTVTQGYAMATEICTLPDAKGMIKAYRKDRRVAGSILGTLGN